MTHYAEDCEKCVNCGRSISADTYAAVGCPFCDGGESEE